MNGAVEIAVEVTNRSERDGQEVAQLYVRQPVAERSRPLRQLKGFEKVFLKAGETKTVTFRLEAGTLGAHDDAGRYRIDPGLVEVYLGGSSLAEAKTRFELTKP